MKKKIYLLMIVLAGANAPTCPSASPESASASELSVAPVFDVASLPSMVPAAAPNSANSNISASERTKKINKIFAIIDSCKCFDADCLKDLYFRCCIKLFINRIPKYLLRAILEDKIILHTIDPSTEQWGKLGEFNYRCDFFYHDIRAKIECCKIDDCVDLMLQSFYATNQKHNKNRSTHYNGEIAKKAAVIKQSYNQQKKLQLSVMRLQNPQNARADIMHEIFQLIDERSYMQLPIKTLHFHCCAKLCIIKIPKHLLNGMFVYKNGILNYESKLRMNSLIYAYNNVMSNSQRYQDIDAHVNLMLEKFFGSLQIKPIIEGKKVNLTDEETIECGKKAVLIKDTYMQEIRKLNAQLKEILQPAIVSIPAPGIVDRALSSVKSLITSILRCDF